MNELDKTKKWTDYELLERRMLDKINLKNKQEEEERRNQLRKPIVAQEVPLVKMQNKLEPDFDYDKQSLVVRHRQNERKEEQRKRNRKKKIRQQNNELARNAKNYE